MIKLHSTLPINNAEKMLPEIQKDTMAFRVPYKDTRLMKSFINKYYAVFFIFFVLFTIFLLHNFIPNKLYFLDFYFIPVIFSAYYLRRSRALSASLMTVLAVFMYCLAFWETNPFKMPLADSYVHVFTWGCFLILAGAMASGLYEKLMIEVERGRQHNQDLLRTQHELEQAHATLKNYAEKLEMQVKNHDVELNEAHAALREYNEKLELMVRQRTEELEKSKETLETLKSKVETALYSTMDSSVIKLLLEGRLRNEKRTVSILFSDLVNFSAYSEDTPPEVVIRDVNNYLAEMEPILLAYNGHIDRYMGDGIMCEFGAPVDYSMYRLMSVLAAIKMQEKMTAINSPWQMRIGIASGTTIIGLVGNKRQSYTAMGDVVNISARLQKVCRPGKVLIDRFTYETVGRFIDANKKREVPTKDDINMELELTLKDLHARAEAEPDNPEHYYDIGKIHMEMNELHEALRYFERAVNLDYRYDKAKVAYAEASLKMRKNETINLRGRRQRIEAYEVVAIKDPFDDRARVSEDFARRYRHVVDMIPIPEDVVLPVEALDGSIGHGKLVAVFSYAIASCLGLSEREKTDILTAGYAADIGKEIIPHHLLTRTGTLTTREIETLRAHAAEGPSALRKLGYDNDNILKIVRHSHENYNGSGYPDGLKGEEIPLGSRIIAVADTYAAMISWRPYRDSWDCSVALDEIARGAEAGIYDRNVVEALIKVLS
jgi:HD-GYP domain-containing protein (c-di-GMP phosphodiesterase class II)